MSCSFTFAGDVGSLKNLLNGIASMYGDEKSSDFTFIVGQRHFKVHSQILGASSIVMQKLFTAEYKEKKDRECRVDHIDPIIFGMLIRFMYTFEFPTFLSIQEACDLFAAAHYYNVKGLMEVCSSHIQANLAQANAMASYALAFKFGLGTLSEHAWEFIRRDVFQPPLHENVKPMPPDQVSEILALRKKTEDEIVKLQAKEQEILKKYTDEPKAKRARRLHSPELQSPTTVSYKFFKAKPKPEYECSFEGHKP